jgi:Cu+-exporting ATPase
MVIDPVCGMSVDENTAPAKADYQGQTYYFCSTDCKTKFQREPEKYTQQQAQAQR